MEDVCRMHGFECAESLVDEVLAVVIGELLSPDDTMHVGLHKFLYRHQPELVVLPGLSILVSDIPQ